MITTVSQRKGAVAALLATVVALLAAGVAPVSVAATATPFRIMVITGINTAQSPAPEFLVGAQAAAAVVNKTGGLRGRQIELQICSHGDNASVASACARKAVEDKVDAATGYQSFMPATNPIFAAAKIPTFGAMPLGPYDSKDPNVFPIVAPSTFQFVAPLALDKTRKRIGVIAFDTAAANTAVQALRILARRINKEVVVVIPHPFTSLDYTTDAQKLKDANVDIIYMALGPGPAISFMQAANNIGLIQQGVRFVLSTAAHSEPIIKQMPNQGNGWSMIGSQLPAASANLPAVKRWRSELAAIGQLKEPNLNAGSMAGWLAIWGIKRLSERTSGEVTAAKLVVAARATKKGNPIDLFGLFKWTPGEKGPAGYPQAPQGSIWALSAKDGQFSNVSDKPIDAYVALGLRRAAK
jgi:ABC-type branched-subunit amino acid transport system substrate-binding protein